MALNIGTNLSYSGHSFLDARQEGLSLDSLKNWTEPIPVGFEVNVEGDWYQYDPEYNSEVTGHFIKRADGDLSGSQLETTLGQHEGDILELMNEVFPVTVESVTSSVDNTWTFEVGRKFIPQFTWIVKRKGNSVDPTESTVNDSTTGIGEDKKGYTGPEQISDTTTYTIKSSYQGVIGQSTISYRFYHRKYYGVSSSTSLANGEILSLSGKTWATDWKMSATTFNCTGGAYPYYVIPGELYNESTFKVWIGGLRNTDLNVSDFNLINSQGVEHAYKVIRLNTLQTGVLSIKFAES